MNACVELFFGAAQALAGSQGLAEFVNTSNVCAELKRLCGEENGESDQLAAVRASGFLDRLMSTTATTLVCEADALELYRFADYWDTPIWDASFAKFFEERPLMFEQWQDAVAQSHARRIWERIVARVSDRKNCPTYYCFNNTQYLGLEPELARVLLNFRFPHVSFEFYTTPKKMALLERLQRVVIKDVGSIDLFVWAGGMFSRYPASAESQLQQEWDFDCFCFSPSERRFHYHEELLKSIKSERFEITSIDCNEGYGNICRSFIEKFYLKNLDQGDNEQNIILNIVCSLGDIGVFPINNFDLLPCMIFKNLKEPDLIYVARELLREHKDQCLHNIDFLGGLPIHDNISIRWHKYAQKGFCDDDKKCSCFSSGTYKSK